MDLDIEKKGATEQIRPIEESSSDDNSALSHPSWTPGFIARFPTIGLGALFGILVCAAGSVATLTLSNNVSQTHWPAKIAPNVIIGGLNNLANLLFGIAIANGVAIAWWRQTLKGSTIEELHRSWSVSTSFKDLALSWKHFNFIALAALTTKLAIVDSILLQRATSTYTGQDEAVKASDISGFINNTIPITGSVTGRGALPGTWTNNTIMDLTIWQQSGGLIGAWFNGCDGLCDVWIPGAGFEITCNPSKQNIDLGTSAVQAQEAWSEWYSNNETGAEPNMTTTYDMFRVEFAADYRTNIHGDIYDDGIDYSTISMNIVYTQASDSNNDSSGSCPGTMVQRTCTLRPAVINYYAAVQNYPSDLHSQVGVMLEYTADAVLDTTGISAYAIYNQTTKQQDGYEVLRYNDIYEDHSFNLNGGYSQLAGLLEVFETYLSGNSSITWTGAAGFNIAQEGLAGSMLTDWPSNSSGCGYQYHDPTSYIVSQINQLMFIYTLDPYDADVNNNSTYTTSLTGLLYRDSVHYQTDFHYMWGALASMFFCVICVLPSYYGYWQLGRKVTLGPFEIANAFRSPVLESEASNCEVKELIRVVGDRRVKYGEMTTEREAGRLAVAEPDSVRRVHPSIGSARVEINERLGEVFSKGWT